ncbi:MAG: acyl carrier protein [Gaiellaceae bacterium]
MAENAAIEHAVREFLTENFPLSGDAAELGADESLIGAGVIDSTGVLEVIGFIEERYEIQIADEEVLPENLDSIASIGRFVAGKAGAARDATG